MFHYTFIHFIILCIQLAGEKSTKTGEITIPALCKYWHSQPAAKHVRAVIPWRAHLFIFMVVPIQEGAVQWTSLRSGSAGIQKEKDVWSESLNPGLTHKKTIILTESPSTLLHNQLKELTFGYSFSHTNNTQGCVKQAMQSIGRGQSLRFKTLRKLPVFDCI